MAAGAAKEQLAKVQPEEVEADSMALSALVRAVRACLEARAINLEGALGRSDDDSIALVSGDAG